MDGAVLLLYVSCLVGLFYRSVFIASGVALACYLVGLIVTCEVGSRRCLISGVGRLLQSALELALNTLSFLRVGAFALGHAALSHTLLEMASHIETQELKIITLGLGHLSIVLVEGLLVFVQTTRLVLFEFFIRFLHADGRLLRPLAGPTKK